jgi:hypothetical protein
LLVEAGPGTGKTRTLIARVEFLLRKGVPAASILALTFSNKAAREIRERVAATMPAAAAEIWAGTFHAFGLEILRKFGHLADVAEPVRPLDQTDVLALLEQDLPVLGLDHYLRLHEPLSELRYILNAISRAKDEVKSADDYAAASSIWLVGMGNLGQAYLWTLGLLPYGKEAAELVLQDLDVLARSNLSTSLLTTPAILGLRKTRAMANWAEARGFKTAIIERSFNPDFRVGSREPAVALIGVDNALARQAIEDVGFDRVIEAGLGRGPQDFLGTDVHTFPASKPAREFWHETEVADVEIAQPAYRAMLERTGDRCGTVRLAGRSIGAPFVGAVAASLVIAELLRLVMGRDRYEVISCHLRDLSGRAVIKGQPWAMFNPGSLLGAA